MKTTSLNGCEVHLLPVIKGLASEGEEVSRAFFSVSPQAVAVSVSKEQIDGLRAKDDYDKYEMSDLEIIYAAHLETFGEVQLPPPAYVKGMELADAHGVPLVAIDMDEEAYSASYCELVGALDLFRESFFARRAAKKGFDLSSPRSFVLDWDRRVNRARGFRELERRREEHMARALRDLCYRYKSVLAIVECERADGVERLLGG